VSEESDEARIAAWVEREMGGRVVDVERQARWRPAWTFDVVRGAERLPVYFRGDRGLADHGVYGLEREMAVLRVLEAEGIPVPHVHGFCESPRGIVMERCAGRANLASAGSDAERAAVLDHYVEILARIHSIDVAAFEKVGLKRPRDAREIGLADLDAWERAYRRAKVGPEPLIEFGLRWLRRNAPRDRDRVGFVCSDSGQFLFEDGRVTAVLDLELGYLGDPVADLAGLRTRDLSEPLGDLGRAVTRYEALTGEPVDRRALDFHTARFALVTPLAVAALVAAPPPGIDLVQYLCWSVVYARVPIELMAGLAGVALDPPAMPEPAPTRQAPAHDALTAMLAAPAAGDAFGRYRGDAAWRVAEYLRRADRYASALERDDLEEVAAILGQRPSDWRTADAALESFVCRTGPESDAQLLSHFHRRCLRREFLLEPVARELAGASLQRLRD